LKEGNTWLQSAFLMWPASKETIAFSDKTMGSLHWTTRYNQSISYLLEMKVFNSEDKKSSNWVHFHTKNRSNQNCNIFLFRVDLCSLNRGQDHPGGFEIKTLEKKEDRNKRKVDLKIKDKFNSCHCENCVYKILNILNKILN
jgi:hypothetical protein